MKIEPHLKAYLRESVFYNIAKKYESRLLRKVWLSRMRNTLHFRGFALSESVKTVLKTLKTELKESTKRGRNEM